MGDMETCRFGTKAQESARHYSIPARLIPSVRSATRLHRRVCAPNAATPEVRYTQGASAEVKMTEREAFRRAIAADPDNDAPRLIYADWLDENGQPQDAAMLRKPGMVRAFAPGHEKTSMYAWVTRQEDGCLRYSYLGNHKPPGRCPLCDQPAYFRLPGDWLCTACYIQNRQETL